MRDNDYQQPILLMPSKNTNEEMVDFSGVACVENYLSWLEDVKDEDKQRDIIVYTCRGMTDI